MAAVGAVFGTTLRPGTRGARRRTATTRSAGSRLVGWNRSASRCGSCRRAETRRRRRSTAQSWCSIETPTNPQLDVCDIRAMVDAARRAASIVAVDNTTATPYLSSRSLLGADFSIASDTKAFNGHSDVVLGHVATRDPEHADGVAQWRTQHGAIPGPMEAWLVHRVLATLPCGDAAIGDRAAVAELLSRHRAVSPCAIPACRTIPRTRSRAGRCATSARSSSFELATRARAALPQRLDRSLREATSFGGVHAGRAPRRWGGDGSAKASSASASAVRRPTTSSPM